MSRAAPTKRRRESRLAVWLLAPSLAFVALLGAFPVLSQFVLSFTHYNMKFADERGFAGLENFARLAADATFLQDFWQTIYFTVISVGFELAFGLAAALVLNRIGRGRAAMNTSIVLPWALPTVVAATMWSLILNDRMGLLNSVLVKLGAIDAPVVWLGPGLAMGSIILADVWKTTPFVAIILLAGLKSIPDQYYEAASLDGAGRWHQFRFVTVPLLRPFIAIALLFRTMDAFRVFDIVWVLTGGATKTETLSVYIYRMLFRYSDLGYGSAMTVALFLIVFLISLGLLKLLKASRETV
ncbi:sugar ABC transporter permease [bacterium]|nr:sugar ABC transporter permease [bacterium]